MNRSAIVATAALCVFFANMVQADDAPPRRPGVLVRLFDIGLNMNALPEMVRGQTPNDVRTAATIDLRGERGDFGAFSDFFLTEIVGSIEIVRAGAHTFRLISDDGSKLFIDGKLVIDHDGLHGAVPKDGTVVLDVGLHELRVLHFESGGGERVSLEWRLPGEPEDSFEVVPASALSHASNLSRETSPGKKRIIKPLRRGRPGDGTPVAGMHPGFRLSKCDVRDETEITDGLSADLAFFGVYSEAPSGTIRDAALHFLGHELTSQIDMDPLVWFTPSVALSDPPNPVAIPRGPYKGQLLVGDRESGRMLRVCLDDRGYLAQGGVFRFATLGARNAQKLGGYGTDGIAIFTKSNDQIARPDLILRDTGDTAFEMLSIRAPSNGIEIEFTQPLDSRVGWDPDTYYVESWPFIPRIGLKDGVDPSPYRDGTSIPVKSASVSSDRRKVFLEIDGLKPSHVVYLRLLPPCISQDGDLPWSTEAWYTLKEIHRDRGKAILGKVLTPPKREPQNLLTDAERSAGWRLLFDGKTTKGWRGFKKDYMPDGWQAVDGCLVRVGPAGDIITDEQFENFELALEWRISAGGNSGIFFQV
ncbi:MAG: DUF1080 domain-containing protein, partial [Planctomycetes bacterium]|nr:DUF1080 domain-containing protein [Planctomycetota bacterium]